MWAPGDLLALEATARRNDDTGSEPALWTVAVAIARLAEPPLAKAIIPFVRRDDCVRGGAEAGRDANPFWRQLMLGGWANSGRIARDGSG